MRLKEMTTSFEEKSMNDLFKEQKHCLPERVTHVFKCNIFRQHSSDDGGGVYSDQ